MSNLIVAIFPYKHQNTWVFDEEQAGLKQEPFVSGAPEIIDVLVQILPNVEEGFRLLFSATPFPNYQAELTWIKEEYGGSWYRWEQKNMEGWLCPALFKYFELSSQTIYCKAESLYVII
ncbi:DUF6717 family protein [Aliterella atlantica]|uniref:Uncharacterized protein n=1 Tax=Aliterella atlantica CENA595 TaxID=1618023 RepID=A0A0D8ZUA8_9CYAN|nr:DUF6717 family protein [Aliterella atlantica]KJH72305.1 hypothetical protein UH38_07735 [Aliterella atlantica CENA595]